jgi:hypothetical protein
MEKIVGDEGLEAGASMRAAPSSSEYSECTWRWTKLSPLSETSSGPGFPPLWRTYRCVIREG